VYGPVRTVVWEGRSREAPPYPDLWAPSRPSPHVRFGIVADVARRIAINIARLRDLLGKGEPY
jgi:hypothetical protein